MMSALSISASAPSERGLTGGIMFLLAGLSALGALATNFILRADLFGRKWLVHGGLAVYHGIEGFKRLSMPKAFTPSASRAPSTLPRAIRQAGRSPSEHFVQLRVHAWRA